MTTTHEQIQYVPVDTLVFNPQVRDTIDPESLQGLARSMEEVGLLQPIRVRVHDHNHILVDGERRARAAIQLGWVEIAVIFEERPLDESDIVQRSLIANCQRKGLTPLETAQAIERLMEQASWNCSQVADRLGFSTPTVSRLLKLLELPSGMREQVHAGTLAASTAYELSKVGDPVEREELAAAAVNGQLTRDEACAKAREQASFLLETRPRTSRAKAVLGEGRSITICGTELTLESVVSYLDNLLKQARKAQRRGIGLPQFLKLLRSNASDAV